MQQNSTKYAIQIKNLNKAYKKHTILNNLNLNIKEGSLFGLLGPNGAGKTTLVSTLNYLYSYESGEINIYGFNHKKNERDIKRISSYVPQTYAFYPNLSAYENLEFFGCLYGLKANELKSKISSCIEITSLENFLHKKAHTFSGGVKRRLNIAIGLLNTPKVLYLDEPTVGIDPQSRKYILDMIKKINSENKTTIIYTSHYMEEVEYLCDEIAILDKQNIIMQKKKDELFCESSTVKIELDNEILEIDTYKNYDLLIDKLYELKTKNIDIKNINFTRSNLEEMFLELTNRKLRD